MHITIKQQKKVKSKKIHSENDSSAEQNFEDGVFLPDDIFLPIAILTVRTRGPKRKRG